MSGSGIGPSPTTASRESPIAPSPDVQGSSGQTEAEARKQSRLGAARRAVSSLFRRFGFDPPGRWLALLSLFALVEIVVISWVQIQAYNSYYTFSQDFGSFNQSFYTAASTNRLFYYTSNLPSGTHGTFFAVHFSPLLFLLLPFYAIAAGPPTLLVMKATALALGAFPVFGLAQRRLGSPGWGFLFGASYLLSPLTMTLDWISFDMEVFLPFLVLTAFYFLYREKTVAFLVFWTLALATIETIAPLLAIFVTLAFLGTFLGPKLLDRVRRNRERLLLFGTLVFTLVWYVMAGVVVSSFNPGGGTYGAAYASHYTILGATSFLDVIPQAVLHPNLVGAALSYAGGEKLTYVLLLLGSLAFLPIFGEIRYSLPVAGWLVLALLSNNFPAMYNFGSQYLGYVVPFLFAGAIGGVVYLRPLFTPVRSPISSGSAVPKPRTAPRRKWSLRADEAVLPATFVLAVAVTAAIANPLISNPVAALPSVHYGLAASDAHTALLDRILGLVPKDASILTTSHVFPQVSSRLNAYVLPSAQIFAGNSTFWGSLDQFINRSSYVLLDFVLDNYDSELIQFFGNLSAFGIRAAGSGIFLFERGWTGPPEPGFWTATSSAYSGASVAAGSSTVNPSNQSLSFSGYGTGHEPIWDGPSIPRIDPGMYDVTIYYLLDAISPGPSLNFRVTETPLEIVPSQYLNVSYGHHYQYVFERSGLSNTLGSTNISSPPGRLSHWTVGTASLMVNVSNLANLGCLGQTYASHFYLTLLSISVTPIGPPSEWVVASQS